MRLNIEKEKKGKKGENEKREKRWAGTSWGRKEECEILFLLIKVIVCK